MIEMLIGKVKYGKANYIKEKISSLPKPVIILDFKNEFDDIGTKTINLGLIDPFLSPLGHKDATAINAGLIEYSQFLASKSEEVLKDFCGDTDWKEFKMHNLIDESIKRAIYGWDPSENAKAKESSRFLDFKKSKQDRILEEEIASIGPEDVVLLKTEDLHSIQTRILTFLFLSQSQEKFGSVSVVSNNINYLWRNGHLFLFSKVFDLEKNHLLLSFNKTENFPKRLKEYIKEVAIFRLENNLDISFFKELNVPIGAETKRFKKGQYVQYDLTELEADKTEQLAS